MLLIASCFFSSASSLSTQSLFLFMYVNQTPFSPISSPVLTIPQDLRLMEVWPPAVCVVVGESVRCAFLCTPGCCVSPHSVLPLCRCRCRLLPLWSPVLQLPEQNHLTHSIFPDRLPLTLWLAGERD